MSVLIGILIVAFMIGLLSRSKGDGCLDTLSSGCGVLIVIVFILSIILVLMMNA